MISVAVATMNRPQHVERVVRSVLAGPRMPHEVLVVDQSAGPETRVAVEAIGSPLVRYLHTTPPSASAARNLAAAEARGEYVAFLDDDCEVPGGWVEAAERELGRFRGPDALWGEIRAPEGTVVNRKVPPVSTFSIPRARVWGPRTHPNRLGYSNHMLARRESFEAVGGFDPRLGPGSAFFGAEDMDLNYRMLRAGMRLASTPDLHTVHHQWRDPADLPRLFFSYNFGHSGFCAKHLRRGDALPAAFVAGQVRDDARMLASAVRRRSRLVARVAAGRARGTWSGLLAGWRAFGDP